MHLPDLRTRARQMLAQPRNRKIAAWAAGMFIAFGAFGFLAGPPIAKSILLDKLGAALQRTVSIEDISVNPYALSATVRGLSVKTREGREVAGFDSLYVNFEVSSLFRGGPVVRELRLGGPRLNVSRLEGSRYDVSDLIDEWSKPSASPSPRFAVYNIQIDGGRFTLADRVTGATHTVEQFKLQLPFISNLAYQIDVNVQPHVSALINGSPLVLEGKTKPFDPSLESELSLDIDRFDLVRYLAYLPVKLPVQIKGATLDAKLKLRFRQAQKAPALLDLAGGVRLSNVAIEDPVNGPLTAWKQLDLEIDGLDLLHWKLHSGKLKLSGWQQHLRLGGGKQQLEAAELALNLGDAHVHVRRGDGANKAGSAEVGGRLGKLAITGRGLAYEEIGQKERLIQRLDDLVLSVDDLSTEAGKVARLNLSARVNQKGSIKAEGSLQPRPLRADLALDLVAIPILPAQPLFSNLLNITFLRGQVSAKGNLNLVEEKQGLGGGFSGNLEVADLHTVDKLNSADFLRWKSLAAANVDARFLPLSLSVGDVTLNDFYARMIVTPEGKLNLAQIVRREEAATPAAAPATDAAPTGEASPAPAPVASARPVPPIKIGKVEFKGGRVNFSDQFVKPNYTVNVTKINGSVKGLSSAADSVADMELRGGYGNAAPVSVVAKLNPLAAKAYLDLKGEIRGVDLTTLSTYSGKYAGYAIEKGKLSLFVSYKLENSQLNAENRVFLDQLTFGDKVDSPDATSLPVKLAVALLKNSRGEIDINLPISGSLDDPQFSVGGVIVKVIVNLFVKAVSSPFALLGSMFAGGADLSTVDFAPGQSRLTPETLKKLEAMAKAMNDRPALKLEITGRADPQTDREGGKRAAIDRAVRIEKQKDLVKRGVEAGPLQSIEIDAKEYPEYLKRVYSAAKFSKPRNLIGLQKGLSVEEMEKLLIENTEVTEDDLRQLAQRRAQAVQAWLVGEGKVPMERVFLLAPKLVAESKEGEQLSPNRVEFSLR